MKFKVEKSQINPALAKITGIIESRNTMPILANIKIEALSDRLKITSTDMDICATIEVPAVVEEQGQTTLPGIAFSDICKKAASDSVTVSAAGVKATITGGRSRFNLGTLDAEDYPSIQPVEDDAVSVDMKAAEVVHMLEKSQFCMSDDAARHYLNGVYLHAYEGALRCVATDGNSMGIVDGIECGEVHPVIIPRKTVLHAMKVFDGAETVKISTNGNKFQVTTERMTLVSKVVDGTFPDYVRILPREFKGSFTVSAPLLLGAIDRISVARDGRTNAMAVTVSDGKVTVSARSGDGDAEDFVDAVYGGEPFSFGVNAKYMIDVLKAVGQADCVVSFNGEKDAIMFRADGIDSMNWLIMPMRINNGT